jgi:hypothetical protein
MTVEGIERVTDLDDLQFANPFEAEPEIPEFFKERRNYIDSVQKEDTHEH